VIDVLGSFTGTSSLSGTAKAIHDDGLPSVTGAADKKPAVKIPARATPPSKTTARTVIAGDGNKITKGDLVVAKYVGLSWSTGKQFDSSWDRGEAVSFNLEESQVIKGWVVGLAGVTAGSRVLLVIPPGSGYGEDRRPEAGIKQNETLVFAVDVLATFS
jgi:peptidylprolyl isomerase